VRAAGLEGDTRLHLDISPGLEMYADEMRIRQVVVNLLTNADRHTPQGGSIVIRSTVAGDCIVTEVRNSGSALDHEQLARVFDRFYRTDPARQRATGGTGLGLAIVKGLVEAHRGRVWASSDNDCVVFGFSIRRTPVGI
jgi:signal transduction histidine kinase